MSTRSISETEMSRGTPSEEKSRPVGPWETFRAEGERSRLLNAPAAARSEKKGGLCAGYWEVYIRRPAAAAPPYSSQQ
eukprot:12606674-Heterocapsa_arctica.AAC.1